MGCFWVLCTATGRLALDLHSEKCSHRVRKCRLVGADRPSLVSASQVNPDYWVSGFGLSRDAALLTATFSKLKVVSRFCADSRRARGKDLP
jgi:hypothetical protein